MLCSTIYTQQTMHLLGLMSLMLRTRLAVHSEPLVDPEGHRSDSESTSVYLRHYTLR